MNPMLPDMDAHFRSLIPASDPLLAELEKEAEAKNIPIVGPLVGRLLHMLALLGGASAILELGAATGYSAICLGRGMGAHGRLLSLECDPGMAGRARANLERAGLSQNCQVVEGDAQQLMAQLDGPFDLAFVDLNKEGYLPALGHLKRLLRPGGLLVADNTAFAGCRDFTEALREDPAWLEAQVLCYLPEHSPEKDGLSLAVKVA